MCIRDSILPEHKELVVTPKPEYGEPSTWTNLEQIKKAISDGEIHPFDAKMAVAAGLSKGLDVVSKHFETNPETLDRVNELMKS